MQLGRQLQLHTQLELLSTEFDSIASKQRCWGSEHTVLFSRDSCVKIHLLLYQFYKSRSSVSLKNMLVPMGIRAFGETFPGLQIVLAGSYLMPDIIPLALVVPLTKSVISFTMNHALSCSVALNGE